MPLPTQAPAGKRVDTGHPTLGSTAAVFPSIPCIVQSQVMNSAATSVIMPIQISNAYLPNNQGFAYMATPVLVQGLSPVPYNSVNPPSCIISTGPSQLRKAVPGILPKQELPGTHTMSTDQRFKTVQSIHSSPSISSCNSTTIKKDKQVAHPSQKKTVPVQDKSLKEKSPSLELTDEGVSTKKTTSPDDPSPSGNSVEIPVHCSCQKAHCLKLYTQIGNRDT